MEFTPEQSRLLEEFIGAVENGGITYVVPRGWQNFPRSVPGGDVDVYVHSENFRAAIEQSQQLGLRPSGHSGMGELLSTILADPRNAADEFLREPTNAMSVVWDALTGNGDRSSGLETYRDYKAHSADFMIHLMNHVAYESPMNGEMIRVHPDVEDSMFQNRRECRGVFVPAKPDELCHLICRGVFSYSGEFPNYYVERCTELYDEVVSSYTQKQALERLLSNVFFGAAEVVLEAIADERYANIKTELISWSGY